MNSVNLWTRWRAAVLLVVTSILLLVTASVFLVTTGCGPKPTVATSNSSEDGEVAASTPDAAKSKKSIVPVKNPQTVKDILGNWVVVVTNGRTDNYRLIIRFSRGADGKISGEFLDAAQTKDETEKAELVETDVDGDAVRLVIKNGRGTFDFVGTFQQGVIRGTIRSNPFEVLLTRLLPTDEKSLEPFGTTGLPPGSDVIEAKVKTKDFSLLDFLNTVREYRTSPIAQDVYSLLMKEHVRAQFDEAKVNEVIEGFLSSAKIWGERWEARMEMSIAIGLINGRQFSRLAPAHIDAAEQKLGEDRAAFQDSLNAYRDAANISIRVQEVMSSSSTDEVRAARAAELAELLKKQPFNPEILLALATEAERTGRVDTAIEYFSDIVALPMLEGTIIGIRAGSPPDTPTPSESLKKVWTQKHGNEDGYLQHLNDVYHEKIGAWLAEIQKSVPESPATESGNKTVLMELFTGMMCPPCVAADLALDAISKTFPTSKVIVLQFHQHIPKPDGLVNQDSEERGAFYEVASTPSVMLDGMPIDPRYFAGPIQNTIAGYAVFRKVIDMRLAAKTDVALQMSAAVTDGQLSISVEATGVPEDLLPSCRLRMAIVENNVQTNGLMVSATNGIRDHEFVVREMPGGAKGIPPKKGELKYSLTMPVAELQQHVVEFITRFEAGRRGEFPAELKPPIRGPLSLVAWVQNSNPDSETRSKLVLQSALIPITGETGFSEVTSTEPNAKEMPAKASPRVNESPTAAVVAPADSSSESIPPPPALPE